MVLADTSVWISHFRTGNTHFFELLEEGQVISHPFVVGELACGALEPRGQILGDLRRLPPAKTATDEEVLDLIERHHLWGTGLGFIDVHLLTSALLSHAPLWTNDKHLKAAAQVLDVAYG